MLCHRPPNQPLNRSSRASLSGTLLAPLVGARLTAASCGICGICGIRSATRAAPTLLNPHALTTPEGDNRMATAFPSAIGHLSTGGQWKETGSLPQFSLPM
jgi:hypothetical protein